jgi:hypothetical protein
MPTSYVPHCDIENVTGNIYLHSKPMIHSQILEGDRIHQLQCQPQHQMPQLEQDFGILQRMKNSIADRSREYMGGAAAAAYNAMRQDYLDERRKEVENDQNESKSDISQIEMTTQSSSHQGTSNPNPNE